MFSRFFLFFRDFIFIFSFFSATKRKQTTNNLYELVRLHHRPLGVVGGGEAADAEHVGGANAAAQKLVAVAGQQRQLEVVGDGVHPFDVRPRQGDPPSVDEVQDELQALRFDV